MIYNEHKPRIRKEYLQINNIKQVEGIDSPYCGLGGPNILNCFDIASPAVGKNINYSHEYGNKDSSTILHKQMCDLKDSTLNFKLIGSDILETPYITRLMDLDLMCTPDKIIRNKTVMEHVINIYNKQLKLYKGQRKAFSVTLNLRGYEKENRTNLIISLLQDMLKSNVYINGNRQKIIIDEYNYVWNYKTHVNNKYLVVNVNTYSESGNGEKGMPMLNIFVESFL